MGFKNKAIETAVEAAELLDCTISYGTMISKHLEDHYAEELKELRNAVAEAAEAKH